MITRSLRAALLVLLCVLTSCVGHVSGLPPLSNGKPGLKVADAALAAGAPSMALQIAGDILAQQPNDVAALICQGEALGALGRPQEADLAFSHALAIAPDSQAGLMGRGRLLLASDPAQAELLFTRVVTADPRNAIALNDLGIARDLQGRHAAAQEAYRLAMTDDPGMAAPQVNLGLSLGMSGHSDGAIALLRPIAENANASKRVLQDLAMVLALAGRQEDAVRILRINMPEGQARMLVAAFAAIQNTSAPETGGASQIPEANRPTP